MSDVNKDIADRLDEVAALLQGRGADPYRVEAYRRAATTVRQWPEPVAQVYRQRGLAGLEALPGVGPRIAGAIRQLVVDRRLPMIHRLREAADPETILASVPGIGRRFAHRLHSELGLNTLQDLEAAAHDGRLATVAGFGDKRLAGIRDSLAHRLARLPQQSNRIGEVPPVAELLDVDREYRSRAAAGGLRRIAPRRFNPTGEAWLPILHTTRGRRRYTALYSNTARAHAAGKTRDWVVLYSDDGASTYQHTVITAARGPHRGCRVVAGREHECGLLAAATAA
jgi:DNA polymerase (family X)